MMPSATQDHQHLCNNPGALMKPESVQMLDANGHRDVSFQLCEYKPSVAFHHQLEPKSMICDNTQDYGPQFTPASFQQVQDPMCVDRDIVLLYSPYAEHHLISLPHDIKDAQVSINDENPAVSAVQMSNSAAQFACSENFLPVGMHQRAKREFVPDERKDDSYWCKRLKNNDSARRSRVKRKALESIMQERLLELQKENFKLKHEVAALRRRYAGDEVFQSEASLSKDTINISTLPPSLPETAQSSSLHRSSVPVDPLVSELSHAVDGNAIPSLDHGFGTEITDHIENNAYSKTNIRRSTVARTESGDSQTSNCDSEMQKTTALDLTRKCNRSTPTWGSFSSDGESIGSSYRRYSFQTSDSSSQEDNIIIAQANMFPLKCRWKKRMQYTQVPPIE